MFKKSLVLAAIATLGIAAPSHANTSHAGWPQVTGMLLMNKLDQARPLDGQPGADPFDGTDPSYSCDGVHLNTRCIQGGPAFAPVSLECDHHVKGLPGVLGKLASSLCATDDTTSVVPSDIGHNELLGGHGSDVIHAGPAGDVLWGDYKPSGQPTTQHDVMYGGPGNDFIYASHGYNEIHTGGGTDVVHAHFGHGSITCDSSTVTVFLSRKGRSGYKLHGCTRISYRTLGY